MYTVVFYAFIINIFFCTQTYTLPNQLDKLENKLFIKEQINNDRKIKYELIIDKLLDKIDITVTDEEIEQYKKELKEKYKMEE
ncbi:hypothetical protein [[Clostridium] colinum]|uniref:hypothetical protein n=1 Tax=[Clostridium] colinum TaxID=36835 RepID=UPI002025929B|nr:hypothetical protein [[Clostridium] colinum]